MTTIMTIRTIGTKASGQLGPAGGQHHRDTGTYIEVPVLMVLMTSRRQRHINSTCPDARA